jgi:glutathione-specific gamma-glutamylcyclotransferase
MSVKDDDGDFWVFGYGSLMWRPGFPHAERHAARLSGYHRSLCLYSREYRGTPERPGLVLGLDRGGSCVGVGFRVDATDRAATQAYLTWREGTNVYRETCVKLRLVDGRCVTALAYVVNRSHADYAGRLSEQELLVRAFEAHGNKGSCRDYVVSTHTHLLSLGVRDAHLASLAERLGMPSEAQAPHRHHDMAHEVETAIH